MYRRHTNDYINYIRSPAWNAKRKQRLEIDNHKCQMCGTSEELQIHHITYDRLGNEDIHKDIVTLCKSCHRDIHKAYRR